MDSFEWNKIFGALLGAAFVVMGLNFLSDGIYHHGNPEKPGFEIAGGEAIASTGGASSGPVVEPVAALLAAADLAKGEKVGKKCLACHNFAEGAANKVGPVLYDIVNRPIASNADFGYSGALKTYAEGKTWTYAELNGFLFKPKSHVKGTSMGFAGLKKTADRAAMIAYLRSLAATPAPLPEAAAPEAEAEPAQDG
ncbi:MAG: cytochrome c family protein [Rhizobiaceae bacterium]